MDNQYYLTKFQKAVDQLDKQLLDDKELEVAVTEELNSVILKLYKKSWSYPTHHPLTASTRIFFSVWVNETALKEQKLYYNIHAFKLRLLKGYNIQSRRFATIFRKQFMKHVNDWQNARVDFGPLTLMEGWLITNNETIQSDIKNLANSFTKIEYLIDETLNEFKTKYPVL